MRRGRILIGVIALGLVLSVNLLAASPSLHEWVHADAATEGHQCAVTLFAHGQVDSATVEVAAITPLVSIETTSQFEFSVFAPAIGNLPAGRAPPVSLLPS